MDEATTDAIALRIVEMMDVLKKNGFHILKRGDQSFTLVHKKQDVFSEISSLELKNFILEFMERKLWEDDLKNVIRNVGELLLISGCLEIFPEFRTQQ